MISLYAETKLAATRVAATKVAATGRGICARGVRWIGAFAVGACVAAGTGGNAGAQTSGKIPDLTSNPNAWAWVRIRADGRNSLFGDGWLDPPAGLRGPIRNDPDHPLLGNNDRGVGRQVTLAFGNYRDPILKPWAAEQMRLSNEEVLSGKRGMPFLATSRCYPGGVPGQLLWTTERLFFIQESKMVHMVWERDSLSRRITMTDQHSEQVKPSWFGESIGRYENGELVVDTIGLSTKLSFIDMFRTPHSEKLHVVERFKLAGDGKFLEALVKVEDPETFNEPMYMTARWRKQEGPWQEFACAENDTDAIVTHNLFPMPEAKTPDF
jgi:hypothetical protein